MPRNAHVARVAVADEQWLAFRQAALSQGISVAAYLWDIVQSVPKAAARPCCRPPASNLGGRRTRQPVYTAMTASEHAADLRVPVDLSPIEAARQTELSRTLIYREIGRGHLRAYKVGCRLRITARLSSTRDRPGRGGQARRRRIPARDGHPLWAARPSRRRHALEPSRLQELVPARVAPGGQEG